LDKSDLNTTNAVTIATKATKQSRKSIFLSLTRTDIAVGASEAWGALGIANGNEAREGSQGRPA
jgi:hypothetical protein